MSLSRPVKFPLLKLPWLCMKDVLLNSDLFDIICFATISNRARKIVQQSKYPLEEIDVCPNMFRRISIGDALEKRENQKFWYFMHRKHADKDELVLKGNNLPLSTSRNFDPSKGHHLTSYTAGDELDALKTGIEFMTDLFGCSVRYIIVDGNKLSELVRLGISSTKVLQINSPDPVNITDLKYLLESIKVIDGYLFHTEIPKDFDCVTHIFKCRLLHFARKSSADWVSLEVLYQFNVPKLIFSYHRFSKEDIVSYVTYWFNSDNKTLEYLCALFHLPISQEDFNIDHLNPMPFCEKRRNKFPLVKEWKNEDLSSGKDIIRQDGLLATFIVKPESVLFFVWHKRFPDPVQQ